MKMIHYFFIGISTTSIVAGIYWSAAGQQKYLKADTEDTVLVQSEQENNNKSFHDFLSGILQVQQDATSDLLDSNYVAPTDFDLTESNGAPPGVNKNPSAESIEHAKNKEEYTRLLSNFTHVEGDEKIKLLEELWQLAPEVGIEENLLTLLQLAIYDPDVQIEKMARKMLSDLQRFKDGEVRPEEHLVSQIMKINNKQQNLSVSLGSDELQIVAQPEFNSNNTASSAEMTQQRNEKIEMLAKLALNAENPDTKDYAMNNLMQFDQDSSLEVIQFQLLSSNNSDERFKALELLRSSIGSFDSNKIRQILITASYDYDTIISENASTTLKVLDNYTQAQNYIQNNIEYSQTFPDGDSGIIDPMELQGVNAGGQVSY